MRWYTEKLYPTWHTAYGYEKELLRKKTKFQWMRVLESPACGRMLVLDSITQTTEHDEFVYHEMMVHPCMMAHGKCTRVLVIGGGDGGILREVLRHPVEKAVQVEIDGEVVEASKKFLPTIHKGAYDDPRTELIIDDGAKYVAETDERFDLVIVDSPDPVGPAKVLFEMPFYHNVQRVLRRGGMMVRQAGVPAFQEDEFKYATQRVKKAFPHMGLYLAPVPTYVGGFFTFVMGATSATPLRVTKQRISERIAKLKIRTRYYNEDIHVGCFALPTFVKEMMP